MEWMILPLKRYADFSGRSRRLEYWMFTLFLVLILIGCSILLMGSILIGAMGTYGAAPPLAFFILLGVMVLGYLAIIVPTIAVQVRRFHDQDKSGWFILLGFIPYVGGIILFVFMCLDGTPGPNRFGPDPKGRGETLSSVFT